MAIKVSGTTVVDNDRNLNAGIVTATSLDVPPSVVSFSPTDGSSDVSLTSNIVITFNATVEKGSGNITLRDGSASGSVIQTIAVSSGSVSISGGQVTINPSDFPTGKDIYVVVDADAFTSSSLGSGTELINTYNFTTGPITTTAFSPSDGATDFSVTQNIAIYFSEAISKGSGNITIRSGSASGTIQQTIDVTSGAVTLGTGSNTHIAFINPPSDLDYDTDTYLVVDAGCFRNADGDVASGNAIINTYNFTTESDVPPLGGATEGGYLICCSSSNLWIVAPSSSEVSRLWPQRNHANTRAQQVSGCSGWFVPSCSQLNNPGYTCRTYWDSYDSSTAQSSSYWSNTIFDDGWTCQDSYFVRFCNGLVSYGAQSIFCFKVRAFRCVSY